MNFNEQRIRQLREIGKVLRLANVGGKPASGLAMVCAISTLALAELIRYGLQEVQVAYLPWWVSLVPTALAYVWTMQRAPHKNYASWVAGLLADYEPMNVKAYRELQEETVKRGLHRDAVEHWLAIELEAVQPQEIPTEEQRFVDKQAGLQLVKK